MDSGDGQSFESSQLSFAFSSSVFDPDKKYRGPHHSRFFSDSDFHGGFDLWVYLSQPSQ